MSVEAPDPRAFESWEDAFEHSIPTVRGMEKKLRTSVDENRDKLRTLVGASYRDLLGTARTIIEIDEQMHRVETLLQDTGRKSDSRILDKIGSNYAGLEVDWKAPDDERLAFTSRVSILQNCLEAIARLLKTNATTLLAAKIFVIARLLHKTLLNSSEPIPFLDTLGNRIASLRDKVIRKTDKRLTRPNVEISALVEDMTAFALVTSSSPTDVFKHFQRLRLDSIGRPMRQGKEQVKESILRRIQLFLGSLKDFRAMFPDIFRASARTLGSKPLLGDERILQMAELNLDVHETWLPASVRNYTPYTRHDELQKQKVDEMFKSWTQAALERLAERVNDDIQVESDIVALAELRREILQMWLSSKSNSYGLGTRDVLNRLREPFLQRIERLIQSRCADLQLGICGRIISTVDEWATRKPNSTSETLFDQTILSMDIKDGAPAFKKMIIERRAGRQHSINAIVETYDTQAHLIKQVDEVVQTMKDTRWDDDFDDLEDEDNSEDESIFQVLSRRDPARIQDALKETAARTIQEIQETLTTALGAKQIPCDSSSSPGVFAIRALREIRQRLPSLVQTIDNTNLRHTFGQDLAQDLHASLTSHTSSTTQPVFSNSLRIFVRSSRSARSLWDGHPPIPVQPTPATFRYLRGVVRCMEQLGPDLWAPAAVDALKTLLKVAVADAIESGVAQLEQQQQQQQQQPDRQPEPGTNRLKFAEAESRSEEAQDSSTAEERDEPAEAPAEEATVEEAATEEAATEEAATEEAATENAAAEESTTPIAGDREETDRDAASLVADKLTQLLFDAIYLQHALSTSSPPSRSHDASNGTDPANAYADADARLTRLIAALLAKSGIDKEEGQEARVRRAAAEYWRRTYLLFGLLSYAV